MPIMTYNDFHSVYVRSELVTSEKLEFLDSYAAVDILLASC